MTSLLTRYIQNRVRRGNKRIIRKFSSTFSNNNNFRRVEVKKRNLAKWNDMSQPLEETENLSIPVTVEEIEMIIKATFASATKSTKPRWFHR